MRSMMEQQNTMNGAKSEDDTLQLAIYKNIEAADSLIDALAVQSSFTLNEDSIDEVDTGIASNSLTDSKSESTAIEELHALNNKLRELISQTLTKIEENQREAQALRVKLKHYESLSRKKVESEGTGEQNLIDFNSSISSSGGSVGIIPESLN